MLFDLVGQRRRTVEHHAKRIVELAEIGVLDQLSRVFRRYERADRNAEPHDQEIQKRPSQNLDLAGTDRFVRAAR